MLLNTSGHTVCKLNSTNKTSINGVSTGKVIEKANIVNKEFEMRFFLFGAGLTFTELRQALSTTSIWYYFDPEYYIQSKTDALDYYISGIHI